MTTDARDAAFDAQLRLAIVALGAGSSPGHPSEDDWVRFATNELSPDERIDVADHVVACTECAAIFRVVSLMGADAKDVGTVVDRQPASEWRLLAAAAAVVLTIGLGVWWVVRTGASDNGQRAGNAPAAPIATPAIDAAAAPSTSWASLPAAPEVRLPADLVLTMRGADGDRDAFLKAFGEAIAPYRAARFDEAAAALTPVAERYADVVEVWFYLGASRLHSGAASEAIEPLRRARSSGVVGDDARWLHAVALQRAGRESEARVALKVLCSESGAYQQRACAALAP
jgi:hypothetical protein